VRVDRDRTGRGEEQGVAMGSDFATDSAPIAALAPGLFSMMMFWPRMPFSLSARTRATKSVGPPGGNATTIFIVRFG